MVHGMVGNFRKSRAIRKNENYELFGAHVHNNRITFNQALFQTIGPQAEAITSTNTLVLDISPIIIGTKCSVENFKYALNSSLVILAS